MEFSNKSTLTSLILTAMTFSGHLAHAKGNDDLWGELKLASCTQKATTDGIHTALYCKGAPEATSISVVDHRSVNYDATYLAQAQCHVSLNAQKVICFGQDNIGFEIENTILAPAANSCEQLQWNEHNGGELSLSAAGCQASVKNRNVAAPISLFDFMVAAQSWENAGVVNDNGELILIENINYGDEVEDLTFGTALSKATYGNEVEDATYGDEVEDATYGD